MGCHFLLQGIFPTQGSNAGLPHYRQTLYHLSHQGSPDDERLLLNHANTPGFLAPGGEEFNPGPEMRLDCSELLCNKVLLKYKEKASDIGIRRGQKEYPLASVNNEVI